MAKQTITEFLANPQTGSFDENGDFDCGVWHDWFCSNKALVNRGRLLLGKLRVIAKSSKFDNDKCYVFFKNNCPVSGHLYDSFSICNIENGDVLYWVTYKSGHSGLAEVWSEDNKFESAIITGNWQEVKDYFLK